MRLRGIEAPGSPRRFPEEFSVGPQEGGIVSKTAVKTGLCARHAGEDQFFCKQKPFLGSILAQSVAGFLLEQPHHMIFADIEMSGKRLDIQFAIQIFINILKNGQNLRVTVSP